MKIAGGASLLVKFLLLLFLSNQGVGGVMGKARLSVRHHEENALESPTSIVRENGENRARTLASPNHENGHHHTHQSHIGAGEKTTTGTLQIENSASATRTEEYNNHNAHGYGAGSNAEHTHMGHRLPSTSGEPHSKHQNAHPTGLINGLDSSRAHTLVQYIDVQARELDTTTIIIAAVCGGFVVLTCFMFCIAEVSKRRHQKRSNATRLIRLFHYLHKFNPENLDIQLSATGGFHIEYRNELAEGENTRKQEEDDPLTDGGIRKMKNVDPNYPIDDDMSLPASVASSVMTEDGIQDTTGFAIICLVILVDDTARGIFFPTLAKLVEALGGSTVIQGWTVAAFNVGRMFANTIFGTWSVTQGYKKPLLTSCSILFAGALFYGQVQDVGRIEYLIFSQFLMGLGTGNQGIGRAFVAEVTATRDRTKQLAWLTAFQYGGFTVTPFIGSFFNKILGNTDVRFGFFRINIHTAPAYFLSIVVAITLFLISKHFQDRPRSQKPKDIKKKSSKRAAIDDHANQKTVFGLSVYDCCLVGCVMLNVSAKGTIACFETLGIQIGETLFSIPSTIAGATVGSCGTLGVIFLLSMVKLSQYFSDVQLVSGGMAVMLMGILSLAIIKEDGGNASWIYLLSMFMIYSIGYPIGHTAVTGLFSKIIGRRPQGTLLGLYSSLGSLTRFVFPIVAGYTQHYFGLSILFYILIGVLSVSIIGTLSNHRALSILSQ